MPDKNLRGLGQSAPSHYYSIADSNDIMSIEELFGLIDLSALSTDEQQGFREWLDERPNMKFTIANALRKGQSAKGYIHSYRKQIQYTVRIED